MNILSKEIIKALEPAEEYFRQVQHGFKRNSPHALDVKLYEVLKSVNPNEPKPNYSCSKCIFELYRKCSKVYNESKEKIENEKKDTKNNNPTTSSTTTSKRRGRKPNGNKRSKP